jgi:hypothetical protein
MLAFKFSSGLLSDVLVTLNRLKESLFLLRTKLSGPAGRSSLGYSSLSMIETSGL